MTHSAEKDALPTLCRFGYEEYDGARYCFEHGGFLEAGVRSRMCDRAWTCPDCRFDAATFEPRPEKRVGALRYHMALHESGRVLSPADDQEASDA